MAPFHQDPPTLPDNAYRSDPILRPFLERWVPDDLLDTIDGDLADLGRRTVGELADRADRAEDHPPELVRYDAWGRRVDRVEVDRAWTELKDAASAAGLVALPYDGPHGAANRLVQAAKIHLFHPSSAVATCPVAMADGAAGIIRDQADDADDPQALRDAFDRLTARDPDEAWMAGQWMTERPGGSDVSRTETVARREDGTWRLHGHKWFASAIRSEVAFTLARVEDPTSGETTPGTDGLALFFLRPRDGDGMREGVYVDRLKDKLGTRALPTAEVTLDGVLAIRVGEPGEGIRRIASLLNITRVHNALCSAAQMRRALDLAEDYARRRRVAGGPLSDRPLHVDVLAGLEVEAAGAFHLAFEAARLLGRVGSGEASDDERLLLRALTPIAKLATAKQAVALISEAIECFGGPGYVEDTGLPRLLRDAQVLPIWEGTTSVLALDTLRALVRDGAADPVIAHLADRLPPGDRTELADAVQAADAAILRLEETMTSLAQRDRSDVEAGARSLATGLARTWTGVLLIDHAAWSLDRGRDRDAAIAARWFDREIVPSTDRSKTRRDASRRIAFPGEDPAV